MIIPHIGEVIKDAQFDWHCSGPITVPFLDEPCRFIVNSYDEDSAKEDFHTAIKNFLSVDRSVLTNAKLHVYNYYKDCNSNWEPEDEEYVEIPSSREVWKHVQFGNRPRVSRRGRDKCIYVSLECNCDWEPEHGLQVVFKNGLKINKIGPYDGHLTNSDAFADDSLENIIYRRMW